MILVDTSVWIDHLHKADPVLVELLLADEVCTHPLVIEELALGSIAGRSEVLTLISGLASATVMSHHEFLALVEAQRLWGRGLSPVDAHLLGSARLSGGSVTLWTRDKRLMSAADDLDVGYSA
jgi:predicted nucleic acid-binding protein